MERPVKMADTYSQMYVQIVFAVKGREQIIYRKYKEELHKYITGIIKKRGQKLLAVNGMPEHIHVFIGFKPNICISDLVRDIKTATSLFIKERKWVKGMFYWQEGFGSFTYSHSQITRVINYIKNQDEHHKCKSFKDEYLELLKKFDIRELLKINDTSFRPESSSGQYDDLNIFRSPHKI